jgi:hypothetical protein
MKNITKQVKINTIRDLLDYLLILEEELDGDDDIKEHLGELLDQSLHGEVFEKEGDSYQYKGIGKSIHISYEPGFGLMFMTRHHSAEK